MKFSYERKNITVEAYGKEYPIPTKTATLVDAIAEIQKRAENSKNALEAVKAAWDGIALFIGEEEAERIFPESGLAKADSDEIAAFWWYLNDASNEATKEVIEKYSPNTFIRRPK